MRMKERSRYMIVSNEYDPLAVENENEMEINELHTSIQNAFRTIDRSDSERLISVAVQQHVECEFIDDFQCTECGEFTTLVKDGDRLWCSSCGKWSPADGSKPWSNLPAAVSQILEVVITKLRGDGMSEEEVNTVLWHANQEFTKEKQASGAEVVKQ